MAIIHALGVLGRKTAKHFVIPRLLVDAQPMEIAGIQPSHLTLLLEQTLLEIPSLLSIHS